jgi:glycine betaine/choline ABC-type transport system substrate-binding protein
MRQQTVQQYPEVGHAVEQLKDKISDQEMQQLNYALDGQHRDVKDVARDFLRGKGLIQ